MREKYLPEQRTIAVAEELAAFLRTEAVDDKGRFSPPLLQPRSRRTRSSHGQSRRGSLVRGFVTVALTLGSQHLQSFSCYGRCLRRSSSRQGRRTLCGGAGRVMGFTHRSQPIMLSLVVGCWQSRRRRFGDRGPRMAASSLRGSCLGTVVGQLIG
jgi:hypothetical protein